MLNRCPHRVPMFGALIAVVALTADAGAQVSPPEFALNKIITSTQGSPTIAMASDGFFVATWTSFHIPGAVVMDRHFTAPAIPVTGDSVVSDTASVRVPAIAMGDDRYVVAWEYTASTPRAVKGQVFDLAHNPVGDEFTIANASNPAVTMHASGSFIVVFDRPDSPGESVTDVWGQRFTSAGLPADAEFMVNIYSADYQRLPKVVMDGDANFVVTWQSNDPDGDRFGVFWRRFDADNVALTDEIQVNITVALDQDAPDIAMRGTGEFAVVWVSDAQDSSSDGVFLRLYDAAGVPLSAEVPVNQYILDMQNDPQCAFDGLGNVVVSWTSEAQDGDVSGVFARRFDGLGLALADEFQVNVQTTLYQFDSDVAADADGNVVVVWQSFFGDGDGQGVFGRYFDFSTTAVPSTSHLQLAQNTPNPFNPITTIHYALLKQGPVTLTVHDLRGRHVVTLVNEESAHGAHSVTWNGTDDQGQAVASGTYVYRLEAGDYVRSKRMVLVR